MGTEYRSEHTGGNKAGTAFTDGSHGLEVWLRLGSPHPFLQTIYLHPTLFSRSQERRNTVGQVGAERQTPMVDKVRAAVTLLSHWLVAILWLVSGAGLMGQYRRQSFLSLFLLFISPLPSAFLPSHHYRRSAAR